MERMGLKPSPLIDEWIKRMWYIHTIEDDSAIKKNIILHGPKGCYAR